MNNCLFVLNLDQLASLDGPHYMYWKKQWAMNQWIALLATHGFEAFHIFFFFPKLSLFQNEKS